MENAKKVVDNLKRHNHVAFFAGGCVRDELLGLVPHDFDVATDATPEQVSMIFNSGESVGKVFGVVLVNHDNNNNNNNATTEVATFRTDSDDSNGRRPVTVDFKHVTAEDDANRRDFTVNALFKDVTTGKVVDFVGGLEDLKNKKLRSVGNPDKRFIEDHLRLLRAVRFTAKLGFTLDENTSASMKKNAALVGDLSRERVGQEFFKMLSGDNFAMALELLEDHEFDGHVLLSGHLKSELTLSKKLSGDVGVMTKLTAWLFDRSESNDFGEVARHLLHHTTTNNVKLALSLSNKQVDDLENVLDTAWKLSKWNNLTRSQKKRLLAFVYTPDVLELLKASDGYIDTTNEAEAMLASGEDFSPEPFVTGKDLVAAGHKPGPEFKLMLRELYDRQLSHEFKDKNAAMSVYKLKSL